VATPAKTCRPATKALSRSSVTALPKSHELPLYSLMGPGKADPMRT
jgi:hypothetical protein